MIKTVTCYVVECDGCEQALKDFESHAELHFDDEQTAQEVIAREADWRVDGLKAWCEDCTPVEDDDD